MASHFSAFCLGCEAEGPLIRVAAGGTFLAGRGEDRRQLTIGDAASAEWERFLMDHHWCPIVLLREMDERSAVKWLEHPDIRGY